MKILIVEAASHFKVLENVNYLLSKNCRNVDIYFLINSKDIELRDFLFPNYEKVNWIVNKLHVSFIFFHLLLIAHKFKYINISTGPEGDHFSLNLSSVFFYIFSQIYGRKTILTIKNIRPYLNKKYSFQSYLKLKSLKKFKGISFETNTMKEVFYNETKVSKNILSVSYDRYIDNKANNFNKLSYGKKYQLVLGLAGMVESERRNYDEVLKALRLLPEKIRSKILFVTLGAVPLGNKNDIIKNINSLVDIDYIKGFISHEQFLERGSACDYVISPLKKEFEYGTYKGSGTLGDAIYLKKKLIFPRYCDPLNEFAKIGVYYDTFEDLVDIFTSIFEKGKTEIDEKFFEKFSSYAVYSSLNNIYKF